MMWDPSKIHSWEFSQVSGTIVVSVGIADTADWLPELSPTCFGPSGWTLGLHEMPVQSWLPSSSGWGRFVA